MRTGVTPPFNHTTAHFSLLFFAFFYPPLNASMSQCAHVPALGFRHEVSLVLSKQTVESSSFCLDGDVEMMSLLLLCLLSENSLDIILAAAKLLLYQRFVIAL